MRPRQLLLLLVVVFIGLACYYSITTPIFESPDEVWHYNFVREIAVNRGLPVVNPKVKQPFAHEGIQPPLYYMLGAVFISWMDPRDLANLPAPNPYVRIGEPVYGTSDNRNAFLHTPDEAFPYHGAALAVHLLRLYSILLGAATVIFTYLLAREIFVHPSLPSLRKGGNDASAHHLETVGSDAFALQLEREGGGEVIVALLAAAFAAFLPQFLFISGVISNDNLTTMLCSAALWQLARLMNRGHEWKSALVLGLLVGGALMAKLSAIALLPLVLLVFAYVSWRRRAWFPGIQVVAIFLAVVALIAGWWYARNLQLYGEVFPFTPVAALVGTRPAPPDLWRWLRAEGEGLRLSTWGVFGWFNILSSPWFYLSYDVLAALGVVGLVYALLRRENLSVRLAMLPIWIGLCVVALWSYSSMIPSTQGRLLFPALSAWAVLWAKGISKLTPVRFQSWQTVGVSGAMFISAFLTPVLFIAPAYSPTIIAANELPADLAQLDRHFENGVAWLGASVDRMNVRAGEQLTVTVYERITAATLPKAAIFIHLVNSAGVIIAQRDSLIASGNQSLAPPPYIVADAFRVSIPVTIPAPDVWRIEMGMYDPASGKRFVAVDQAGIGLGETLALATLTGSEAAPGEFNFDFDGRVSLVGASLDRTSVAPGGMLRLTLIWRGAAAAPGRYHVFVHVLGEGDHIWAAADSALDGQPTTQLDLHFDGAIPAGVYPIELGVYPAPDGDRLGVFDAHGQDLGDRLFLGPVRVTP